MANWRKMSLLRPKKRVTIVNNKKPMPYHCGVCRKYFSVKVGTVMESSRIPLKTWLLVTYMMTTARKGVSSCQISREIGVTQKTAWFMLQRIRESWTTGNAMFSGKIEIDEAYFGGKESNKHASSRIKVGRGITGKVAVMAIKSRENGYIKAFSVSQTNKKTIHAAIKLNVITGSTIYTDDHKSYLGIQNCHHETVKHSVGEYVKIKASINGVESFWSLLKRGYYGIFHHFSPKHLNRYVSEFSTRHNILFMDSDERFGYMIRSSVGKRITYAELIR